MHLRKITLLKGKVSDALVQAHQAREEADGFQEEGRQWKEVNGSLIEENQDFWEKRSDLKGEVTRLRQELAVGPTEGTLELKPVAQVKGGPRSTCG